MVPLPVTNKNLILVQTKPAFTKISLDINLINKKEEYEQEQRRTKTSKNQANLKAMQRNSFTRLLLLD